MISFASILQYLGGVLALSISYKVASFIWLYTRPSALPRYHHGAPGSTWALVTGASDGIGHGFAQELCSQGFNVVLHGRNPQKLASIKHSLEKKHPEVQIQLVVADAFDPDADIDAIASAARSLPGKLTLLVNNVGGSPISPTYGSIAQLNSDFVDKIINLNARFPAQLTRALTPLLVENSPSLVMNIGSAVGVRGIPYLTMYSASKAFNLGFTQALKTEMAAEGHDVEVLGIIVGSVATLSSKVDESLFICSPRAMARASLARVGCGEVNVWGWYRHALQWVLLTVLPEALAEQQIIKMIKRRKVADEKEM